MTDPAPRPYLSLVKPDQPAPAATAPVPDDDRPVPVDQPGPSPAVPAGAEARRPIVAPWLTTRADFTGAVRQAAGRAGYTTGYHLLRAPWYGIRLAATAPRGTARLCTATGRWVWDREAASMRQAAAEGNNIEEYLKLAKVRGDRVRARGLVLLVAALGGTVLALTLYVMAPGWLYLVGAIGVLALGYAGQTADAPVIGPAVIRPEVQKLTSDIVLRALAALGIAGINQAAVKGRAFAFTAPITRDGPGWRAEGDLPFGVTVSDVMDRRDRLASGLRRPLGCVWPEAVPEEHTGRLVLWVGDQDMSKSKQPRWGLARAGKVDLFTPAPFGTDQRGRWVDVTLMYISGIIGAVPRMGKTFLLRLLVLIAALDPRAELHLYDLKGTGDLGPLEPVAHRYRAGDDVEDIEYAIADMRALREELRRRTKVIRGLPRDICPESKVTSTLADNRTLGLHPVVVGVDECQVWFEHKDHGGELEEICTDLVKRGPAAGITLLLATQRPDAKSLPTGISANAVARWCLKVMGQVENDMVLGTSSYKRGVRATLFAFRDKGIHYFVGEGEDARIVRSVYVDAPGAEAIVTRAAAARREAGLLSGHAIGEQPAPAAAHDLVADVLAVVPAAEAKVWNETVVARLAELRPDVYGGWEAEQLTAALKPRGISTGQVWGKTEDGKGANRRGIVRADLVTAGEKRG